MTILLVLHY